MGKPSTPVNLLATDAIVWNIHVSWGFPAGSGDTAYTELEQATTSDGQNPLLLANVPYPSISCTALCLPVSAAGIVQD